MSEVTNKTAQRHLRTRPSRLAQQPRPRHIVDMLIEERAPSLQRNPVVWQLVRSVLYPMLHYREAVRMADKIADMRGREIFDWFLDEISPRIEVSGIEHVPADGRCIIVANHPTGIVDGIALYGAIRHRRPDLCYLANRDAIRVAPKLTDMIVPVEWVVAKRSLSKTKEMWRSTKAAFDAERAVVIFPSGRVAQLRGRGLVDRPWQASTINLARRNQAPIVPLHVGAWNSLIYYGFSMVNEEMRDMTVFNELLNKKNKPFSLTFGSPISHEALQGDVDAEILRLRHYVENDLKSGGVFSPARTPISAAPD